MEKNLVKNPFCRTMAGIKVLHYIDIKNVSSIVPSGDGMSVTLASNHTWKRIDFSNATAESTPEGVVFNHVVDVTINSKGNESVRDLMTLSQGRYMVRVTDNNGVKWLKGTKETPLRMSITELNDGIATGETNYKLTFQGLCVWPEMKIV